MKISALHHVSIDYQDWEDTMAFYGGILGLGRHPDAPKRGEGGWLQVGDSYQRLNLSPRGRDKVHFALVTSELAEIADDLRAAGCELIEHVPGLNLMTRDPSGNWVELRRPPADWAAWAANQRPAG